MIENFNKIIENKDFEEVASKNVIQRKNFLNEVVRSHDLIGLRFAHLTFLNCNFIDIDFRHTLFICCDFKNCNFTETIFFKSELNNCNFKNCKIVQSDLVKAEFTESNFTNCHFDSVNMAGSVFTKCEWIQPKFYKVPTLQYVTLSKSKIWNSKKCIEVDGFDNVAKIIDNLGD
jgi:uncharacterized protein YjbI with pentapeptide repeats